ncbi:MAG: hypothetical protein QM724_07265 [Flavobacteriales bacterium]
MRPADDARLQRLLLGQERFLEEVRGILAEEQKKDDVLRAVVRGTPRKSANRIHRLDPGRVFSVAAIRRLCIRYDLRFLDAGRYKGELPSRALYELRRLEARAAAPLVGFKVMAPARCFQLCDPDADPLLFVPVGAEHYYLVHKWGSDLSPWRALFAWPKRGPLQLACTVLMAAVLLALMMPNAWIGASAAAPWWNAHRLLMFVWGTLFLAGCTSFAWMTFFGQFSTQCWNSRYFS